MVKDKVVVVTGSAQGIGKHAARTFAQEGARVVIADFNEENAGKTAAELGSLTETLALTVDMREEAAVERMFEQVVRKFGQVDVLVNNAAVVTHFLWGIPRWPSVSDMSLDFWNRVIQTNLGGTFLGTKHAIHHMASRKSGHIINLYGGGSVTVPGTCAYAVTKDAIRTFTRFTAEEVRDANVCLVTFSPRLAIVTETAPEEALKRMPHPDVLGRAFVLAAQLPMEMSGLCVALEDGKLVKEGPMEG